MNSENNRTLCCANVLGRIKPGVSASVIYFEDIGYKIW